VKADLARKKKHRSRHGAGVRKEKERKEHRKEERNGQDDALPLCERKGGYWCCTKLPKGRGGGVNSRSYAMGKRWEKKNQKRLYYGLSGETDGNPYTGVLDDWNMGSVKEETTSNRGLCRQRKAL